jgi:glycosyltransferase involved in cell wall biosynthesis
MRIAVFPSAFHPHLGGVEELTRALAHAYVDLGHDVLIVTNRWPRDLPRTEWHEGLCIRRVAFRVWTHSPKSWVSAGATGWARRREVRDVLADWRPDVVHVQCISSNGEYARMAAAYLRIPLVVTTQGEVTMDAEQLYQRSRRANVQLRAVLQAAAAVTAVSTKTLRDLESQVGHPLADAVVIHNGTAVAQFRTAPRYVHVRPYLLAVGRLVPQKGFDDLLAALATADIQHDLLIAGDGPERDALQAQALKLGLNQRVHFVGASDRRTVAALHAGSDFFVLPSRVDEGLPLAAVEAMAAGQAIVATRTGGLPEVLKHGRSALFVEMRDVVGLSNALRRLADDTALRSALGRRAGERADDLDWGRLAQRYLDVFASVRS